MFAEEFFYKKWADETLLIWWNNYMYGEQSVEKLALYFTGSLAYKIISAKDTNVARASQCPSGYKTTFRLMSVSPMLSVKILETALPIFPTLLFWEGVSNYKTPFPRSFTFIPSSLINFRNSLLEKILTIILNPFFFWGYFFVIYL